jgi:hypothetical protein
VEYDPRGRRVDSRFEDPLSDGQGVASEVASDEVIDPLLDRVLVDR